MVCASVPDWQERLPWASWVLDQVLPARPHCSEEVHNDWEKNDVFMSIIYSFKDWPLKQGGWTGQACPAQ